MRKRPGVSGSGNGNGCSRRAVLRAGTAAAAATLGAAGCGLLDDEPSPQPPDPLVPLLDGTVALIARYEAALAAHPDLAARLTPVRAAHAAHASELARLVGDPASSPAATAGPDPTAGQTTGAGAGARGTLAALRAAEQGARRAAAEACLAAPAERAALLGSIAAARASHIEALR